MNTATLDGDATTGLPRAGYWRRSLATLIDMIVVMFPFQVLAAVLFAQTAGMVQMDSGFFTACAGTNTIPQALSPPPPRDPNFARVCRTSFFGATTGATLTVGRVTKAGATTTTVSQTYMLDKEGTPINGTSIDGIVALALLAYLVVMIWKTGRTLGARVVKVRVVDTANPNAPHVPLRKAVIRYLAMAIGAVPALAILLYQYATTGGTADALFTDQFFQWFIYAAGLGALWVILLIFQIAAKKDPVYDWLAGTAVLRGRTG
jgi:RDD family